MKKITFGSLLVIVALLLSSCQFHTGLGSLLSGKKTSNATPTKHIKATHTPPSPKTPSANQTVAAPASNAVSITSAGFQPNTLSVKAGTTVTWTNNDAAAHTVTSDSAGVFDSGPINQGATFKFTFSQAGTFPYHSTSDSGWAGTITVTQ
ncbi:MAG TPA: cupredoxin domain-containing protein [Anaerolineales bacterium]|nr:cupredoxin domain-containing protein [Anaerolineales bacterium]